MDYGNVLFNIFFQYPSEHQVVEVVSGSSCRSDFTFFFCIYLLRSLAFTYFESLTPGKYLELGIETTHALRDLAYIPCTLPRRGQLISRI
jgi:hypothetical protein